MEKSDKDNRKDVHKLYIGEVGEEKVRKEIVLHKSFSNLFTKGMKDGMSAIVMS